MFAGAALITFRSVKSNAHFTYIIKDKTKKSEPLQNNPESKTIDDKPLFSTATAEVRKNPKSKLDIGGDVLRSIATPVRQVSAEDVDRAAADRISQIGVPTDIDSVLDSHEFRAIIRMGCQHAMEKV
jgi:hypothetical protein